MAALLTLAGCATTPLAHSLTGQWGGRHAGLDMGDTGGRLEYDCAAGSIDGPVVSDAAGRFAATGTHTPGTGGPDRVGVTPPSYPARYSGSVRGEVMTLVVEVPAINARIGPVSLRRGVAPDLMRCL